MANSDRSLSAACEHFQTLISAELDGELSGGEQAELQSHLQHCPECLAFRADCRELAWNIAAVRLEVSRPEAAVTGSGLFSLRHVNGAAKLPAGEPRVPAADPLAGRRSARRMAGWTSSPWFWGAIAAGLMLAIVVSASRQLQQPARPQFPLDPLLIRYASNVEAEEDQQATLKLVQMDLRTMRLELNRLDLDPETRQQLEKRIASLLALTNQLTQTNPTPRGDLR